ncbi:MAG: phosphoribosylglycinamide formyltransferase [Planctomycetota bacterium]
MPPLLAPITDRPARLGVLISGGGSTLKNLERHIADGELPAEVAAVVASNPKAADAARERGVAAAIRVIERARFPRAAKGVSPFSDAVFGYMRDANVDLVCMAGFLSLLEIAPDFANRTLNIHPSLLPAFGGAGMYGQRVHAAVLKHGCKVTGCTVHLADDTYDTGPILVQRPCPVLPDDTPDTLAARCFEQECIAYPEAINAIVAGRVHIEGHVTRIAPNPS